MSRFRGIGDDTLKVISDQNQEANERARISEQRRSNRAGERLEAQKQADSNVRHAAELGEQRREFDIKTETAKAGDDRDFAEKQRQFDAEHDLKTKQWARNEEAFTRTKSLWEEEDAKRRQALEAQNGAFAAVVRASLFSPAVPDAFIRAFNESAGVADGDPGSMKAAFKIADKEGRSSGIGYVTVDQDGNEVKNLFTPEQVWMAMGAYPPETQKAVSDAFGKMHTANDPMNAARLNYMKALMQEEGKNNRAADANATRQTVAEGKNAVSAFNKVFGDPLLKSSFDDETLEAMRTAALAAAGIGGGADAAHPEPSAGASRVRLTMDGESREISASAYKELKRQGKLPAGITVEF